MAEHIPGRVSVSPRALERVFAGVAAFELGSPAKSVTVRVRDDAGRLGVSVEGPARRTQGSATLLDLGSRTRAAVTERGGAIAGVVVGSVSVRVTDTSTVQERVA